MGTTACKGGTEVLDHWISTVVLGKVRHKLQIPLPGRGYWIKKELGKPVEPLYVVGYQRCLQLRQTLFPGGMLS